MALGERVAGFGAGCNSGFDPCDRGVDPFDGSWSVGKCF